MPDRNAEIVLRRSEFQIEPTAFEVRLRRHIFAARPAAVPADAGNINLYFAPAFFRMLNASKKIFLLFGDTDRLYWDFDEKFYQRQKNEIGAFPEYFELHLVKDARHIFEERAHQDDLFVAILSWIEREYADGTARAATSSPA